MPRRKELYRGMSVHDLWSRQTQLFLRWMLDGDLPDVEWREWTYLQLESARRTYKKQPHVCRCSECESYQWEVNATDEMTPFGR